MQMSKIKLALGLVVGASLAMPMVASAAADQEAAMKDANNWAHPRGQQNNQGYSALSQINKGNVKNVKAAWTFATSWSAAAEATIGIANDAPTTKPRASLILLICILESPKISY